MLLINNNNTNPYFNFALEEYLLKKTNEDLFRLWMCDPCISVGKNQNTISEINADYVKENSIPIVRRLSGGGAVFHDLGNLNFTFISCNNNSFSDFKKFTQPIINLLKTLGINAEFSVEMIYLSMVKNSQEMLSIIIKIKLYIMELFYFRLKLAICLML